MTAQPDQSSRGSEKRAAVQGFGVNDLTGNVDEQTAIEIRTSARPAGLLGGAWGNV
jgi:hypothetical protein